MDLVLKAVIALTVSHSTPAIVFGYNGRRELFNLLQSATLLEARAKPNLKALQAALVIAILDYGNGLVDQFEEDICLCSRLVTSFY